MWHSRQMWFTAPQSSHASVHMKLHAQGPVLSDSSTAVYYFHVTGTKNVSVNIAALDRHDPPWAM